jgi:hypothetical protein
LGAINKDIDMTDNVHLSEVFGTNAEPELQPEPELLPEPEEPQPEPEPEPKGEITDVPPASKDERFIPISALLDERLKRQSIEQQFEAFQRQIQQNQPKEPTFTKDDYYDNPEKVLSTMRQELQSQMVLERINMTETFARSLPDGDKYVDAFIEAAGSDPYWAGLAKQMQSQQNPGKFAYEQGKKYLAMKDFGGDPAAYREKLKAEVMAEIAGKQEATQKQKAALKQQIPDTLSDVNSGRTTQGQPVIPPLSKIFN